MKIQEMSFMLLGLVLFFIIVGLFFIVIAGGELQKTYTQSAKEEAIFLIVKAVAAPELNYGSGLNDVSADADKLVVLKNRTAYKNFWPVESLVIRKVFPYSNKTVECHTGLYEGCNTFTIKPSSRGCWTTTYSSYIAICRREYRQGRGYDHCDLGLIEACPRRAGG